jgi:hypothetical protein
LAASSTGAAASIPPRLQESQACGSCWKDGSYAVTDRDGRYHFEGVAPGTHVVQLDDLTLPARPHRAECASNTRAAGRAFSASWRARAAALKRVDFRASAPRPAPARRASPRRPAPSDAAAARRRARWSGREPGRRLAVPEVEHNPRAADCPGGDQGSVRGQSVMLFAGGQAGGRDRLREVRAATRRHGAVSLWRGIPLVEGATQLSAEVRNADGSIAETLRRTVRYGANPIQAQLLRDKSVLVADGVTRPVLAIRLTDRHGRPVRHGLIGDFEVPAPYYPAVEADAQQARQLAGLERARPFWKVEGEDGVAFVELEPTTASGTVSLRFDFRDGEAAREQRVEAWLDPGDRPWTIVGLAQGTIGYNKLAGHIEDSTDDGEVLTDGRLALYAKGRVRGKWLMTLAYDSDKKRDETRFRRNDRSAGLLHGLCRPFGAAFRRRLGAPALPEARAAAILRFVRRL